MNDNKTNGRIDGCEDLDGRNHGLIEVLYRLYPEGQKINSTILGRIVSSGKTPRECKPKALLLCQFARTRIILMMRKKREFTRSRTSRRNELEGILFKLETSRFKFSVYFRKLIKEQN
jgi:hypothetical protein